MNEELNKVTENPVEELEIEIASLPEGNPNMTVTVLPPEEDSNSVVPIILGTIGAMSAAAVGGLICWKKRKSKAERIRKLEEELVWLKEQLGIEDEDEENPLPEEEEPKSSEKTE